MSPASTRGLKIVPQHGRPLEPEQPAEGLVDEGQTALGVAAQDDVGLVVEQVAVAGLVLADLPLDVLERLEPALQALADVHEALELGRQIARVRVRSPGCVPLQAVVACPCSAARFACDPAGIGVETRLTHARLSLTPVTGMQPYGH